MDKKIEQYINSGVEKLRGMKYREAKVDFDSAIKLDSKKKSKRIDSAFRNRSICNAFLGNIEDAIKDIEAAVVINPKKSSNYSTRGTLYANFKKKFEEAKKDYQMALKLDKNNKDVKANYELIEKNIMSREGYLTFADILGWKGIWQNTEKNSTQLVLDLLNIKETLLSLRHSVEIDLISDTFVIYSQDLKSHVEVCNSLIELCLEKGFLIRGATSYGKLYTKESVYVGPAVDEAASWHEKGEEVVIFFTPSARLKVGMENYSEIKKLEKRECITKNGKIDTFSIDWFTVENKEKFYKIMLNTIVLPELNSKYSNTEKYLLEKEKKSHT